MKIVHLPRRFVQSDWGGTETVILETSKCMRERGLDVEVVCPDALSDRAQDCIDGVPVRRFPYFYPYWGLNPAAKARLDFKGGNIFSFALMNALRADPRLDLIHLHTGKRIGGIGRYVAKKRALPYVITLHGGVLDVPSEEADSWTAPAAGSVEWGKALGWWVGARRVLDDAAAILCVGGEEQKQLQKRLPNKQVLHLPNGVNVGRFAAGVGARFRRRHAISDSAPLLLTVGRIDPQKNQLFLMEHLPRLLARYPDLHLAMIGHVTNQEYHRKLISTVSRLGLEARVRVVTGLPPSSRDLVDAFHAADIFVLPSIHEPFGIVILEAWAAGRPVIASRVGGIPSFVQDNVDGVLLEPNNGGHWLRAIERLLADGATGRRLAQAGKTKAQSKFSWETVTDRLIKIYQDVRDENSLRQ